MWNTNEQVTDIVRTTLKSGLDLMNVYLGGIEHIQAYRSGVIDQLRADHGDLMKQIESISRLEDLQAIQADVARKQLSRVISYWTGMFENCTQCQSDLLNEAMVKSREISADIDQKIKAAPASAVPVLSAIQMVVGAAQSTFESTSKATEGISQLGAAQLEAAKSLSAARRTNGAHGSNGKARASA